MLRIRPAQMRKFEDAATNLFEDSMWDRLQTFAPELCQSAGEARCRAVIQHGIERSQDYGFTNRGPVRLFIEMMYVFGFGFDDDPQYPWVGEILRRKLDQQIRAEQLYDEVERFRLAVHGENNRILGRVFNDIAAFALPAGSDSRNEAQTVDELIAFWKRFHPERFVYCGERTMNAALRRAFADAAIMEARTPVSRALVASTSLLVGHRFAQDPLYAWIGECLARDEKKDEERFLTLHSRACGYLRVCAERFERA
ncbi:MAG: hypothetical protein KF861_11350 [Planctomycetaceae bacterium]|nr:hypothetical protein [Planctomycetaceae bacterium]